MHVMFRGKLWLLERVSPSRLTNACADCDAPDTPGKKIRVSNQLTGLDELEVLLHEAKHACHPDMAESAVAESARCEARMLWRLGWRCER